MIQIAIIGDYQDDLPSHQATDAAIKHAARKLNLNYSTEWIPTDTLEEDIEKRLRFSRALLVAPGSPYLSLQGTLNAIRLARESGRPLLGTCGGFQHIVLEYARNVLGLTQARHEEYELPDYEPAEPKPWKAGDPSSRAEVSPSASSAEPSQALIIRALPCSLDGKTLRVDLAPNSQARRIYGRDQIEETYHCNYGLHPAYRHELEAAGLRVSGTEAASRDAVDVDRANANDKASSTKATSSEANSSAAEASAAEASAAARGEARIVELPTHPFFIGTLFVPQMHSTSEHPHPLIEAFIRATIDSKVPVEERPTFDDEIGLDE